MTAVDLQRLGFPCPDSLCPHAGECWEAKRRRAEGGHTCVLVASPRMDTPGLVAAACSCGRYRSAPGVEREVRKSWRQHADAKMGWVAPVVRTVCGIRPHRPLTAGEARERAELMAGLPPVGPEDVARLLHGDDNP